nr:hypothetical protein [Aquisalimonas sp.]
MGRLVNQLPQMPSVLDHHDVARMGTVRVTQHGDGIADDRLTAIPAQQEAPIAITPVGLATIDEDRRRPPVSGIDTGQHLGQWLSHGATRRSPRKRCCGRIQVDNALRRIGDNHAVVQRLKHAQADRIISV